MYFELAWQFGMPVSELLSRMSSFELAEWIAFLRIKEKEREDEEREIEAKRHSGSLR